MSFDSIEPRSDRPISPDTQGAPAASGPLADEEQRDRVRRDLDATLVVEAAAGTGKTTELVRRMVALLEAGRASLDRVVAVTFTEAAAGELKLRLRGAIEAARLDESRPAETRESLRRALPKLEEARIGTIHSFCADLLREHPIEAGVDPRFEVAPEDVARPLFERAFSRWFESRLERPGPGVRRVLRRWKREPRFGGPRRDEGPRGLLRAAAWQLVAQRDFPAPWRRHPGFDRDPEIDAILLEMEELAACAAAGPPDDWFTRSLREIETFVEEVRRVERVRERDHDALEGALVRFERARHWGWKGWSRSDTQEFPRAALLRRRDALRARLHAFVSNAGADLAPLLRDELWPVVEAYEEAKSRAGCLDFEDLLIRARDLVRESAGVRAALQQRFTHYFVDEFQDTDPLQVEILMLLAADRPDVLDWRQARIVAGKLFLVGDPKQSIYRFRRADVALYREVQARLVEQGATLVRLTVSFRAAPEIQEAVNAAFRPLLGGDAAYVPLTRFREGSDSQPAVVALPVPAPYGDYGKAVDWRIEESLPDAVAAWIDWLVNESGWTVTERENPRERVKVTPRHVCVLFRRFRSFGSDVTRPYVAALEARRLPHLLVGGSSFHEREEIEALRNALSAIERPDDELAVFATLRGPLLAISDAALLAWREKFGSLHPYRPAPSDASPALAEVAEALAVLRELHRDRNRRPVADTIARFLDAVRAPAGLAIWPTGMQALANVGRFMDMARRAEQQGIISFRAFVDRLEDEADRGEATEAPLVEEGIEGVRIMTVHKAKGLEFPIVVLADMTANATREQPDRWVDPVRGLCVQRLAGCTPAELRDHAEEEIEREREEAVRLVYVAATRARDVLVVPALGDERREGWLAALHPAIYPDPARARRPVTRVGPGCPAFGEESVPFRPEGVMRPFASIMPGLHQPEAGTHQVIWWDPAVLTLGVRASIGLAHSKILETDSEGRADSARGAWEAWRTARDATIERGATPTRVVRTATEWARSSAVVDGSDAVELVRARPPGLRPFGPRFGTLVHALLAVAGLDDDRTGIAGHAGVQARLLGATEGERETAIGVVAETLAHPLLRRAAQAEQAGRCRREAPLLLRLADGILLEAVADLAYEEEGGWIVVDFKTDVEIGIHAEVYRRQVALYVAGVAETTGQPARGYVLEV